MADLDDFFAKKDRKKSKSVKKFTTADELAKKLDDNKQKPETRPKKERTAQEGEDATRAGEEEEWKEYEEPVKDYTGLKIQVLQGGNNTVDQGRDSLSDDGASDNGKGKGPWNKPTEATTEQPAVEEKPREQPKQSSGAYVPPVARNRPTEAPARRAQPKNAPDIHNAEFFPVLGAARRGGPGGSGGGWTLGATPAPPPQHRDPLPLGNRFTQLQDS